MDANEPDKWDRAAIFQQWKGLEFRTTKHESWFADLNKLCADITNRQDASDAKDALIGDLRVRLEELEKKHETMAAWIKERLKNGAK